VADHLHNERGVMLLSVRVSERSRSTFEVNVKMDELVVYTSQITSNTNVFKPGHEVIVDRVQACAIDAGMLVWQANGIRVDSVDSYHERHGKQEDAVAKLNTLLYLITICKRTFHLRSKKVNHWTKLATEAKKLVVSWKDSDARRYKGQLSL
jgi:hypothetical protein